MVMERLGKRDHMVALRSCIIFLHVNTANTFAEQGLFFTVSEVL